MVDVEPDWKPVKGVKSSSRPRRMVDRSATKGSTVTSRECVACGVEGANAHHVLPKDKGGDDVRDNLVTLCGSGTMGCHGAHHGNPYTQMVGGTVRKSVRERRDAEWVNRRIGSHLTARRPDTVAYVLKKLGKRAGREYLRRTYFMEVT